MTRKPNPALRLWQRIVNRWRKRIGWERVGTGDLNAHLHPKARTTGKLPTVLGWMEEKR